jgi:predicted anti-sigma-YlaC factor YlaD
MTQNVHEKVRELIDSASVEGISPAEREWLEAHLDSCEPCRARARANQQAIRVLRSVAVPASPGLISATQARVRRRAQELREERLRMRALWVACGVSWILGVASAPLVWWGLKWLGEELALPKVVWAAAFVMWWLVPAAAVAVAFASHMLRSENGNGYAAGRHS